MVETRFHTWVLYFFPTKPKKKTTVLKHATYTLLYTQRAAISNAYSCTAFSELFIDTACKTQCVTQLFASLHIPAFRTGCRGSPGCVNLSQRTWRASPQAECSLLGSSLTWRLRWWRCTRNPWQQTNTRWPRARLRSLKITRSQWIMCIKRTAESKAVQNSPSWCWGGLAFALAFKAFFYLADKFNTLHSGFLLIANPKHVLTDQFTCTSPETLHFRRCLWLRNRIWIWPTASHWLGHTAIKQREVKGHGAWRASRPEQWHAIISYAIS